ncbi:recombinase family protein [Providencia hangzhouensis]|uniref:recombinase family protein n=1 Tax=Providencia hangzhouensis TaxID=3031799 RepID=UPI0034DD9089
MLIGYARVSKADGSQSLDLQHDALRAAGVERDNIYDDLASGGTVAKLAMRQPFCLIQRPYISKTLLTRRISPRGSP